jgi:uncharacterized protein (TIGR00725 family)
MRRSVVAVIGSGDSTPAMDAAARQIGRTVIESGARLVTGGVGGVMAAASEGAHAAVAYREGDVIGILASYDAETANPWVDVALPTGLGHARNTLVVGAAEVVVLVGGDAGALSEAGLSQALGKCLLVVEGTGGTADILAAAWREREGVMVGTVDEVCQLLLEPGCTP